MVMGIDSLSEGCGFKSQHHILDGLFPHMYVVKIVKFVRKDENKGKKRTGMAHFFKKMAK